MTLDLNCCKEYRFSHGKLISAKTGNEYKFRIGKGDRFYNYIRQHIMNGKVNGITDIKIDELFITDLDAEFLKEQAINIDTLMLVTYRDNKTFTYKVKMDNVSIVDITSYELRNSNDERMISLCTLKIPHNTEIMVSEITD